MRHVFHIAAMPGAVRSLVLFLCLLLVGTHMVAYGAGGLEKADLPAIAPVERQLPLPAAESAAKLAHGVIPQIEYSTFIGGKDDDVAYAVAVDPEGNAYIAGATSSPRIGQFAEGVNKGRSDALLVKVSPNGQVMTYARQLGGQGWDSAYGLTVDAGGNVYIVGTTLSDDFPTVEPYQKTLRGARNAFVTKLNGKGEIAYSTYLGGAAQEVARVVVADGNGGIFVAGETSSTDFPSMGVAQRSFGGGGMDGFIAHFDATGRLLSASYLGGSGDDKITAIARGKDGSLFVAGSTTSLDLNSSFNLGGSEFSGQKAFVAKLSPTNLSVEYITKLGGNGNDLGLALTIGANGTLYLAGSTTSTDFPIVSPFQARIGGMTDGFIASISPDGRRLLASTYLGGEEIDYIYAAALDARGNLYVTGETRSPDFPLKHNISPTRLICTCGASAFVTKFVPQLNKIIYSTTVSGSGWDYGYGIAVDSAERAHVVGNTNAHDFPTTPGSAEEFMQGVADAFLFRIGPFEPSENATQNSHAPRK